LKTGKFRVALTAKTTQKQWEGLAAILNELRGTHKVWSLWRKVCYKLLLSLFMQHKVAMVKRIFLYLYTKKKSVKTDSIIPNGMPLS
jgi:hypothetical protein